MRTDEELRAEQSSPLVVDFSDIFTPRDEVVIATYLSPEESQRARREGIEIAYSILAPSDNLPFDAKINQLLAVAAKRANTLHDGFERVGYRFLRQTSFVGVQIVNFAHYPYAGKQDETLVVINPV